jgi:hypothetical protein
MYLDDAPRGHRGMAPCSDSRYQEEIIELLYERGIPSCVMAQDTNDRPIAENSEVNWPRRADRGILMLPAYDSVRRSSWHHRDT